MKHVEKSVALLLDDLGARIVVFVHTMTEAHQSLAACFVLGRSDELRAVITAQVNLSEHFDHCLVGSSVQWSPKGADTG